MPFSPETAAAAGRKGAEARRKGTPKVKRDYQAENIRQREQYTRFQAKLRNDEAERLQALLDCEGLKFTQWVRSHL